MKARQEGLTRTAAAFSRELEALDMSATTSTNTKAETKESTKAISAT